MTGGGYRMLASVDFGGLVLGSIKGDFCVQILIFSGFSRSTRFSCFCTAQISKIQRKTVQIFAGFFKLFSRFSMKFAIFLRNFDEILPEFHRNVEEMTKNVDTAYSLRKTESLNYLKDLVWKK